MRLLVLALAIHPLFGLACSAGSPDGDMLPEGPDAGPAGPDDPGPDGTPELSVDELSASTPYLSIPVTGSGPANGTVIVETAIDSAFTNIGADGRFCLDVELQEDVVNTLWISAMDTNGVSSDVIEKMVRQDGDPPDGDNDSGGGLQLRNIAELGTISKFSFDVADGQKEFLNDGDPTSMVELDENYLDGAGWVVIQLTETAPLHSVRVRSQAECPAKEYKLYVINSPDPPDPSDYYDEEWWLMASVGDKGGSGDETHPSPSAGLTVSHLAFHPTMGCGGGVFTDENFKMLEIEVFTEEEAPSGPAPQGPSCASGATD